MTRLPHKLSIIVGTVLLLCPIQSWPQELSLPHWEVKKIGSTEYACYDLETSKELVQLDFALKLNQKRLKSCEEARQQLDALLTRFQDSASTLTSSIDSFQDLLRKRETQILKLEQDKIELEKHSVRKNLPWIVSSALLVGVVAFAGGWLLRAK